MNAIPPIRAVMTPLPYSIDIGEDVLAARVLMDERGIHHLPVMSNGKIAGLISDRDIQVAAALAGDRDAPLLVREVCHMPAYVTEEKEPLDHVLLEMAERQLSSAVVVDHRGRLTGILTLTDVCRICAETLAGRPAVRFRRHQVVAGST